MKIMSVMPAAAASSTAYWISGLSTIGSISFGLALVTGRNRLPRPATGNTTFVSLFIRYPLLHCRSRARGNPATCRSRAREQGDSANDTGFPLARERRLFQHSKQLCFVDHFHTQLAGLVQLA